MKPIVHTCPEGTFACDYTQGEATKVKRAYLPPIVEVVPVRIEKGYSLSGGHQGMTEGITDYGYYDIGDPNPYYPDGEPMTEGIVNGSTIFF